MESTNALQSITAYFAPNLSAINRGSVVLRLTADKRRYNGKALNYE